MKRIPEKLISKSEVAWRLNVIFLPLVVPQFLDFGENMGVYIPMIWMIFFAPIYFSPPIELEYWEDSAKKYQPLFVNIGKIYFIGMFACYLLNVFLGKLNL
jgi:hypothetical protein